MACPACGRENPEGFAFCGFCGTALGRTCANCGADVPAGFAFCGRCGTPVASTSPAPTGGPATPQQPVAERRLVSVLFADLVGFTSLSEGRDAEEVRELLGRYFDTCRRLIGLYGGTIEKFIGDAVMAVWGAPVATEDDAERAVRAALDLVQAVADLGAEVGHPSLKARAGVLTGEAAVNLGAEGQGIVAGDLVNTASRIQSAAEPGTVAVGEATRRSTEAAIVYADAGTHELKGKAEPIPLWRAVRVVAGARGELKSERLEAPFVGRDRELRTIKEQFFSSAEDRKAHLISVIGIAGIGKSRLSWEFYKYFDGISQLVLYHRGRCLAYGEGVAYWPLVEMVKMRCRIAEVEDAESAAAKLRAKVEEVISDPEERRWVEPRLAHLLGLEDRNAIDRQDLFAGWRRFFERLSETNPVLMVFEDMQWADASLVDFVDYLMEWSRNHPILVLTLGRPEFLEARPTWGSGQRSFTSLYLEPLPEAAMTELIYGLVPGLPAELADRILARAEGIPLYAVETIRMLLDRGLLVQEGAVYVPTGPVPALEVPETLHALIAARLDGLSSEERHLIQDAAVLGKTFFKHGLAAISGRTEESLDPLLASLVRKEVLGLQADPRSPERGQYGFLQDLVKRVAYETLSRRERKAKHLAAADFVQEQWGGDEDEIVEVVASHYLQAYEADPAAPDAAAIKASARSMLVRAGERAASLAADQEAFRYYEQAIALSDEPLAEAELHDQAGRMAWRAARQADARAHLERAIELYDSIGQTHPSARAAAEAAIVMWQSGELAEAVERLEAAFVVLSADEPGPDLAVVAAELGRLLYFLGRREEALSRVESALQTAEALRLREVLAQALQSKGNVLVSMGRPTEGIALIQKALEIALEDELWSVALRAYTNLAASFSDEDRFIEADETATRAVELSRLVGNRWQEVRIQAGGATNKLWLGAWDEAAAVAEELLQQPGLPELAGVELVAQTLLFVSRGDLATAERVLGAVPDGSTSADVQTRAVGLSNEAILLRARGRPEEALAAGEAALALRSELGMVNANVKEGFVQAVEAAFDLSDVGKVEEKLAFLEGLRPGEVTPYLQAQGARFAARLAALRGEWDKADQGFRAAEAIFRDRSMRFWLAVTMLEHAEGLLTHGGRMPADPLLAEAGTIFEQLGARPWLERLDRSADAVAPQLA